MYTKIIIGAGLGGLIHGILHKKMRPNDKVIIYEANRIPGGFCTAFRKSAMYKDEKITYTVNIPLITSDFRKGEHFDQLLHYLGVKNIRWKVVDNLFKYYPLNGEPPFVLRGKDAESLVQLAATEKERENIRKFFQTIKKFYNDLVFHCHLNPTPWEAIQMLCKTPSSIIKVLTDTDYLTAINKLGIQTQVIKEVLCAAEAFMGVEADEVSAAAEFCMIQSFLQNASLHPAEGDTFQTLSDNLAARFAELGGEINFNSKVTEIQFEKHRATGVTVNGQFVPADSVVISTAQDVIKPLLQNGAYIPSIQKRISKIDKLSPPNSDYYSFYLIDKKVTEEKPDLLNTAYHIYKLPEDSGLDNWKLPIWVPDELINGKYYVMALIITEKDQKVVDDWIKLRSENYKKYTEEKEKMSTKFLRVLQRVEPIFQKHPPLKHLMTMTPASYLPYGSKYPISGLAQTPENFLMKRMTSHVLENLFISSNANFCCGVWGAIAGTWQGFVTAYEKEFGIKIGNKDIIFKPELKNLPQ